LKMPGFVCAVENEIHSVSYSNETDNAAAVGPTLP